jgi:flavin reductase (DIM6/NTAB) family NADH-FMN oxidoreductase RutF
MSNYKTIIPAEVSVPEIHHALLGSIGPRPICFASTVDLNGTPNLAPFSFFNVFSAKPPILVFSPARSGRTGEAKHTHLNVKQVPEVVINVVTYEMVNQMSLASSPFERGVDEFKKAGFTPVPSDLVKPARVGESPVQLECKVNEVIELGDSGGAGNLIVAEVLKMHIREDILMDNGKIDQEKIDLIARMGGDWYCRANGEALFEVAKPISTIGIGIDKLPKHVKDSHKLTGNQLGLLGSAEREPNDDEIDEVRSLGLSFEERLNMAIVSLDFDIYRSLSLVWLP